MCVPNTYHCILQCAYIPTCRTVNIPRFALLQREDSIGKSLALGAIEMARWSAIAALEREMEDKSLKQNIFDGWCKLVLFGWAERAASACCGKSVAEDISPSRVAAARRMRADSTASYIQ